MNNMDHTFMTFNLRYNTPNDGVNAWPHRAHRVVSAIKQVNPLIMGTQEGQPAMLKDLEQAMPEYGWVGEGRVEGEKGEYCAIFYKKQHLCLIEQGQFWLSEEPEVRGSKSWDSGLPRICTWVQFCLAERRDTQFIVFNTHLDDLGQLAREKGIRLIWQEMKKQQPKGLPMVLMGDMNAQPQNEVIKFLRGQSQIVGEPLNLIDAYSVMDGPAGLTSHGFNGGDEGEPIDYIFVTSDVHIIRTQVIRLKFDGGYPSDHHPVIVQIRL
jgi:endonuclease/exonuclease/phosphatase family metal-dependent hydrolase